MPYRVEILPVAQRRLKKLDSQIRKRIAAVIDLLTVDPRPPGVKNLVGAPNGWRIRAGDYRILYEIHDRHLLVLVVVVGHRGDVDR